MFKSVLISLAILATAPLAIADNCNAGLKYCGHSLLAKGNYGGQIDQALMVAGQEPDNVHKKMSIFKCLGGSGGAIVYETFCGDHCRDNDWGNDDTCN